MTYWDIHRELGEGIGTCPIALPYDPVISTGKVEVHTTWGWIEAITTDILYMFVLSLLAARERKPSECKAEEELYMDPFHCSHYLRVIDQ